MEKAKLKPPPLQTSLRPSSAPHDPTPPTLHDPNDHHERFPEVGEASSTSKAGHQNFVLTDPVAFRYLEEDPSTTVIDRRRQLQGYECYLVEQWTTSRTHPTFMITTYTGDPSHTVWVGVLSVPTDENAWSPRLRVYFRALNQYHARRRQTELGILMVTNLSNFPSSLTVIPVPDGNIREHRFDFFVNENLKRLGCAGRAGLTLTTPAAATIAKFHQLYRTSEKNDIYKSVLELVKLCQSALTLFGRLEIDYADGLLCDVTERAVNDWWVEMGHEKYNAEPHDGILGPTTVAGLLGLLMGARNRLHAMNAPVPKDPFDVEGMKKGINSFQKQQRMQRTRRLDRHTLERLHKATQKAADKDRWAVPKAVKSTMAELSGKGGEMVMEAVGRRDRAGIAEIETVDMDRFVQLLYGDRAKWLWLGKPVKKHKANDSHDGAPEEAQGDVALNQGLLFKSDEQGGFTWAAGRKSVADGLINAKREQQQRNDRDYNNHNKAINNDDVDFEEEDEYRPSTSMFKRATTIKDEAKSGFGRVKGAVGLRGHKTKPSTDETVQTSPIANENAKSRRPLLIRALSSPVTSPDRPKSEPVDNRAMPAVAESSDVLNAAIARDRSGTVESRSFTDPSQQLDTPADLKQELTHDSSDQLTNRYDAWQTDTATASIEGSIYNGIDLDESLPAGPQNDLDPHSLLRRTLSYSQFVHIQLESHPDASYPRQLSFSLAEDSVLTWKPVYKDTRDPFIDDPETQLAAQKLLARESKYLSSVITTLQSDTAEWTSSQIRLLQSILQQCDRDQESLDALHEPRLQSVRELQVQSEGILRTEKERLEEGTKDLEAVAAKLEYEIDGLKSRVEDVAAAVTDFEKGVVRVEDRVLELEREGEKPGWRCVVQ